MRVAVGATGLKKVITVFKDWAGQEVAYRLRETREDEERTAREKVTCEVNPHGDAWHIMGRGPNEQLALADAMKNWNEYDQR